MDHLHAPDAADIVRDERRRGSKAARRVAGRKKIFEHLKVCRSCWIIYDRLRRADVEVNGSIDEKDLLDYQEILEEIWSDPANNDTSAELEAQVYIEEYGLPKLLQDR